VEKMARLFCVVVVALPFGCSGIDEGFGDPDSTAVKDVAAAQDTGAPDQAPHDVAPKKPDQRTTDLPKSSKDLQGKSDAGTCKDHWAANSVHVTMKRAYRCTFYFSNICNVGSTNYYKHPTGECACAEGSKQNIGKYLDLSWVKELGKNHFEPGKCPAK
jgi:hypothetical protein